MPISYRLDPERSLIRTTASGTLTDDDIVAHKTRIVRDPAFHSGMRELSDIREVHDLQVTPEGIQQMVQQDASHGVAVNDHKLAIVVSQEAAYGMARMYQTMTEANVPGVRIFRDMDEAESWLRLGD